jgi:hypothetical protein
MTIDEKLAWRAARVRPCPPGRQSSGDAPRPDVDAVLSAVIGRAEAAEGVVVETAQTVARAQAEITDLKTRLATIEGAMRALAVEAERNLRVA